MSSSRNKQLFTLEDVMDAVQSLYDQAANQLIEAREEYSEKLNTLNTAVRLRLESIKRGAEGHGDSVDDEISLLAASKKAKTECDEAFELVEKLSRRCANLFVTRADLGTVLRDKIQSN